MSDKDVMPDWVQFFHGKGLAVQWLYPNSKKPIGEGWTKKPVASINALLSEYRTGYNLGFRTGVPSTINGKCLAVLDVDIKSLDPRHREEMLSALRELLGEEKQPNVLTGGGGMHYFIFCDESDLPSGAKTVLLKSNDVVAGSKKPAWAIELLSTGSNCVLPPSIHPDTGDRYKYQNEAPWIDGLPEGVRKALFRKNEKHKAVTDTANCPLMQPPSTPSPETEENITKLKAALAAIPPCLEYNDWIKVLFSVRAHGWKCSEAIAREWSATCVEKYSDDAFTKAWNSDKAGQKEGKMVGAGTVYHMAEKHGWKPIKGVADDVAGDTTNGRLFAQYYRGKMLYCFAKKQWLRWNGDVWKWCDSGEAIRAATWVADRLVEDAANAFKEAVGTAEAKQKVKAASSLHGNENRLQAMLNMAASVEGMGVASVAELDDNPMLLGVRDGVVDLRTGQLIPAKPELLMTRQAGAEYRPEAQCPRFLQFMSEIFTGDQEMIAYLQRALGYTLTGRVDEEVLFFMFGYGANGKSVLANIIAGVMGNYAITASADILAKRHSNANAARGDIARLSGARLVLANETRLEDVWDDQIVKTLVSREKISARFNYGELFDFFPTHKLWVRGNHQPRIQDSSDGMWRRLHLIGFEHQVPEDEQIPDLDRRLLAEEADGILKWMVDGALVWQKQGLKPPASIRQATAHYRKECDLIEEWMSECCELAPEAVTGKAATYSSFSGWCLKTGIVRPMSQKRFTRSLRERGHASGYEKGDVYCGLRLKPMYPMM